MKTKHLLFTLGLCLFFLVPASGVPVNGLVGEYLFSGNADDSSITGNDGAIYGASLTTDRFGNSQSAYFFDGISDYIEIPTQAALSIATTGSLTVSVWISPAVLDFPSTEGEEYIHWMGKGDWGGKQEWVLRMYNFDSPRPNRISCYAFNLTGGLGAGSYTQETLTSNQWIHIVATYNYPEDRIRIYKNGVQKDQDLFSDYDIIPAYGTAPVRIGTRNFTSYFKGAIDDIRFYNRELSAADVLQLYQETSPEDSLIQTTQESTNIISPSQGKLYIQNPYDASLQVFDIKGALKFQENLPAGNFTYEMEQGTYIILLDGKATKVIIN